MATELDLQELITRAKYDQLDSLLDDMDVTHKLMKSWSKTRKNERNAFRNTINDYMNGDILKNEYTNTKFVKHKPCIKKLSKLFKEVRF